MKVEQFYVKHRGKIQGPFTFQNLQHFVKTSQINPETPILVKGSTKWRRADAIEGLFPESEFPWDTPQDEQDSAPETNPLDFQSMQSDDLSKKKSSSSRNSYTSKKSYNSKKTDWRKKPQRQNSWAVGGVVILLCVVLVGGFMIGKNANSSKGKKISQSIASSEQDTNKPDEQQTPDTPEKQTEQVPISSGQPASTSDKQSTSQESAFSMSQMTPGSNEKREAGARMVKTVDGIEYAFRWCPAGTFMMGPEDKGQHQVTLTKGFWMLETEVTQKMWRSVMGKNLQNQAQYFINACRGVGDTQGMCKLAQTQHMMLLVTLKEEGRLPQGTGFVFLGLGEGESYPIYFTSWNDCQEFCRKLSEKIGMIITLPTEAQWEYACRADSPGPNAGNAAWDDTRIHPVGQNRANAWGLHDMLGNVSEWCQDREAEYPSGSVIDPMGPDEGSCRILRGGDSFLVTPDLVYRTSYFPHYSSYHLGFRVVATDQ